MILQHRQGRTLVLAIGLPRAGLGTLTKVGVRCIKEVVVAKVRVSGGGGGGGGRRRLQPHQGPAPVQDEISPGKSSRVAPHRLNARAEHVEGLLRGLVVVVLEVLHRHVLRNEGTELFMNIGARCAAPPETPSAQHPGHSHKS